MAHHQRQQQQLQMKRQQDKIDKMQEVSESLKEQRPAIVRKEVQPKLSKEQIIQQQIRNGKNFNLLKHCISVYIQTMQKIQQMSAVYQQQQATFELQHKILNKGGILPDFAGAQPQQPSVDPMKFEEDPLLEKDLFSKVANTDVQSLASNIMQNANAKASEVVANILAKVPKDNVNSSTVPMLTIGNI